MPQEASSSDITQSVHELPNEGAHLHLCNDNSDLSVVRARSRINMESPGLMATSWDICSDLKGWHETFRKVFEHFDLHPISLKFEYISSNSVKRG